MIEKIPYYKNDPIVVLLLSIITCGIFLIFWNIKIAKVLNAVKGTEVISQPLAIFSGCCTPVHIYYYYLAGKECLPALSQIVGEKEKDQTVLLMVLGFFFPMVAAMILQGEVNKLYK